MEIDVKTIITILSLVFSVYMGLKNLKRADTGYAETKAVETATINVKLDRIGTDVSDIKNDVKNTNANLHGLEIRVAKCEESTKSAHHRIDGLEGAFTDER